MNNSVLKQISLFLLPSISLIYSEVIRGQLFCLAKGFTKVHSMTKIKENEIINIRNRDMKETK